MSTRFFSTLAVGSYLTLGVGLAALIVTMVSPEEAHAQTKKKKGVKRPEYNDPQGRFKFQIPTGWTVTQSADTVVAIDPDNVVRATFQKFAASPSAAIKLAAAQLASSLTNLKEVKRGEGHLLGEGSLYAVYTAKNGKEDWTVKISSSKWGWTMMEENRGPLPLPETENPSDVPPVVQLEYAFILTDTGEADAANVAPAPVATDLPARTVALSRFVPRQNAQSEPSTGEALNAELARQIAAAGQAQQTAAPLAGYAAFAASNFNSYGSAQTNFLVLFADGNAIGGLPTPGMDGFNLQMYAQQMARAGSVGNVVARYQFFPDHLQMTYPNFTQTFGLPNAGGIGGLVPLCQCNGTIFGGVYAYGNLMVQFSPDGTFIDRGALDNLVWKNFGAPRGSQGRYALQYNTLYIQNADGRQARISFAAPAAQEGSGSFDWIAIDQKTGRRVQ